MFEYSARQSFLLGECPLLKAVTISIFFSLSQGRVAQVSGFGLFGWAARIGSGFVDNRAHGGSRTEPFDLLITGHSHPQRGCIGNTLCGYDRFTLKDSEGDDFIIAPPFKWNGKWFRITKAPVIRGEVEDWTAKLERNFPGGVHQVLYCGLKRPPAIRDEDQELRELYEGILDVPDEQRYATLAAAWRGDTAEMFSNLRKEGLFDVFFGSRVRRFFGGVDRALGFKPYRINAPYDDARREERRNALTYFLDLLGNSPPRYIPFQAPTGA